MTKINLANWQKYSGVAGVLVLWTGVIAAMHTTHLGLIDARPISYLGVDSRTAVLFSGSLLVSSFLFVNFAFYVRRQFKIKDKFLYYFLIGQVGQVTAALVPYGHGTFKLVHTIAAFTLAFSLPLLIRQFVISQPDSPSHKLYTVLLRLEQCAFMIGIGLFVFTPGIAPLGEALPAIGFHIWIIAVTCVANKTSLPR